MKPIINYNEDKYFDDLGIEEIKMPKVDVKSSEYKSKLIGKIREKMSVVDIVPSDVKPIIIISTIDLGMEYIRNIGDSENFRLCVKNKINEFRNEKQMSKYKKKLNKYYNELDSMMECD